MMVSGSGCGIVVVVGGTDEPLLETEVMFALYCFVGAGPSYNSVKGSYGSQCRCTSSRRTAREKTCAISLFCDIIVIVAMEG